MKIFCKIFLIFLSLSGIAKADPGIQLGSTRVIYYSSDNQASVDIKNSDNRPYLIQSWIEDLNGKKLSDNSPFITTPPLFKLEDDSSNSIRIVYTGKELPQDRESAFWINVKSIPSQERNEQNTLVIAIKTQIKLFYRPAKLDGVDKEYWSKIKFNEKNGYLVVNNPTPFYISFNKIKINDIEIKKVVMAAPFSTTNIDIKVSQGQKLSWDAINDYGGVTKALTTTITK